jgi:hypothetical protein
MAVGAVAAGFGVAGVLYEDAGLRYKLEETSGSTLAPTSRCPRRGTAGNGVL